MKKYLFLALSTLWCTLLPFWLLAQLTLRLTNLPVGTPADAQFFVAGSFNNWSPGDAAWRLVPNAQGQPEIVFNPAPGAYEYKFTRGSWATVEGNEQGGYRPNRTLQYNGGAQTIDISVLSWEDVGGGNHTAAPNVSILSANFYMPQLNRSRRIWLYLPPNYETSGQSYPVLYMHDGQNLFDVATSFSGEWRVDETLNELFTQGDPGVIVVGIDNGGGERINEYTPWPNPQYGGGDGEAYIDFIAQTLKPYIDENYRTLSGPAHTGIMGSSLGGLISLYGVLRYPMTFGRGGIFSPSLWFTSDIYTYATQQGHSAPQRLYFIAGQQESSSMVGQLNSMHATLLQAGYAESELRKLIHADGQHAEWYWAREFGAAYQWLFAGGITGIDLAAGAQPLAVFPNPATDTLRLSQPELSGQAQLFDAQGRPVRQARISDGRFSLRGLPAGLYWLRLQTDADKRIFLARVVKQ